MKLVAEQKLQEIAKPCLRQKADFNDYEGDLKLFQRYPLGDTWPDANLASVFFLPLQEQKGGDPQRMEGNDVIILCRAQECDLFEYVSRVLV